MSVVAPPYVSLTEWETTYRLNDDAYELVAGVPTMTPPESGVNIDAASLLHEKLAPLLRPGHRPLPNYGVHVRSAAGRDTVRQPDLVVVPRNVDIRKSYIEAADAVLVVEVISPSSIERDWVAKRDEYAAAGIPSYLIIDVRNDTAPRVWLFELPGAGGPAAPRPVQISRAMRYPDPAGDGSTVSLRIAGHEPITVSAAELV